MVFVLPKFSSKRRLLAAEIFSKISGATLSQGRATYHITIWQINFLQV